MEESDVYSVCIFFCVFTVDQALNKYVVQIGFHLPKRSPIIYYDDYLGNQLRCIENHLSK